MGKNGRDGESTLNGGTVLNISSVQGLVSWPMMPTYTAAKTAVVAYTRSAGHQIEFAQHGVKILCLCPHATFTEQTTFDKYVGMTEAGEKFHDSLISELETNQLLADEVGEAAVKVMSDGESSSVWFIHKSGDEPYKVPDQNTWDNLMGCKRN